MAFMVLKEKGAADKVRDFTFAFDLVCSVRSGGISSQPLLKVGDFRLGRVRNLNCALFGDEDDITLIQEPANPQFIDLKICRPPYQNEKRHANLFRYVKTPWRADLDRTVDRTSHSNCIQ